MNEQAETTLREINNYEEYLSTFLPKLSQTSDNIVITAEEIGVRMAEETLTQIRELLADSKTT
jgi:hypothetical protein